MQISFGRREKKTKIDFHFQTISRLQLIKTKKKMNTSRRQKEKQSHSHSIFSSTIDTQITMLLLYVTCSVFNQWHHSSHDTIGYVLEGAQRSQSPLPQTN